MIVLLGHVLELRLHHASRHGGDRLARPRTSHHVSHVRSVRTDRRGHSVTREGRVLWVGEDLYDLLLCRVCWRLVVAGPGVHLLYAGAGGGSAGLGPVLGRSGRDGRGLVRLARSSRSSSSRPHVLVGGRLVVCLGHHGHVSQHLPGLRDHHPHHGCCTVVLARGGVEAGLGGGVAGRHELLVRVVRGGHSSGQDGMSRHLQRRGKVRTPSSSSVTSSAIILPLASSLVGAW